MDQSIEHSHHFANLALAALRKHQLPATPRNIELWYAHAEGRNPALSRDIQKALRSDGRIDQTDADDLYDRHVLRRDLSRDVIDLVSRFEAEVARLGEIVEESGENAAGANVRLHSISGELKRSAADNPAVGALIEGVLTITKSMRETNAKLENRLARSSDEISSLRMNVEKIQTEAMLDPLTGVRNRKTFDNSIVKLVDEAQRDGSPLALIFADIDHFKKFNDTFGHQTGDQVLRLVADVMNANVKGQDLLARYGGEEFAIILPGTTLDNAEMLADRIRAAVEARRLKHRRTNQDLGSITLSMGVALLAPTERHDSLIERADACLYEAKRNGRNAVVAARHNADRPAIRNAG